MKQKTIHKQENISYNPGLEKSQPVRKQYPENETFDQGNDIFQNEFFTPISPRKHKLKYCFNCGRQINFYTKICHYCETSQPEIIPQTNELYFKTKYRITSEKKIDNKNQIPVKNDSINSDFFFQNHIDNDFSEQIIIDNNKYNTIKIKPYIDKKKIKRINDSHTYLNYITINHKFINRDYEYDLLYDKARKLNYGKGCLVIIQGESGI